MLSSQTSIGSSTPSRRTGGLGLATMAAALCLQSLGAVPAMPISTGPKQNETTFEVSGNSRRDRRHYASCVRRSLKAKRPR
jgi:hypothetical protein